MIQKPRGTEDLFNEKVREFFALELIIRNLVDLYNYQEIRTPIFESLELFKRSVGEQTDIVSKEMYVFNDKKNRELALKPEGTAPTVRSIIENKLYINENLPLKLFYFGSMFRYERPQSGRQRQFNQFGVEVFGKKTPELDAEILCLAVSILRTVGIEEFQVNLNYLITGEKRETYIAYLKETLSGLDLCQDCQKRIELNPLRVLDCKIDAPKFKDLKDMKEYLSDGEKEYYQQLKKNLNNLGITYQENGMLVRGLDYYTGFVFEVIDDTGSTLIGGGRYDNLVQELGNVELQAAGFGMGIERIINKLETLGISLAEEQSVDCYIIALCEKAKQFSSILLLMMRSAGIKSEFNYQERNLKSAFKFSEKLKAKNIIIIGENELKNNVVVIKNQITKKEITVPFDKIIETIREK